MEPKVTTQIDGDIATTTAKYGNGFVEVEITWNAKTFEEINYVEKINCDPDIARSSEQFIPKEPPASTNKTH